MPRRAATPRSAELSRLAERVAIVIAALVIAVGVIAVLSGGLLAGRDNPGVSAGSSGPGVASRDQGDAHLNPGAPTPAYDSNPPTSGPHAPVPVTHDESTLTDDQLLQALSVGDVVLMYGTRAPASSLRGVATAAAAPFSPALAASGQAVILARRPGTTGVTALAWTRTLRVANASDPALRAFAQAWLGRGAPH